MTDMKIKNLAGIMLLTGCLLASCQKKQEFIYSTTMVEHGDVNTTVTATGTIEPVTSVDVGTQVSGIVSHLYVDYNSIVKAGQVIAELDKTNLMTELRNSKANLANAQSNYNFQKKNFERYKNLYEKGLISTNDYDQAELSFLQAKQQVAMQQESVRRAETNLGYATITSPIDGVVLSKEVEEGQTVASSFNTPTLFKIAQDLTQMRVIAKVDEADIGEVKEGLRVTFTVDAFPMDVFEGNVTQVRQEPTTESNVVTYEVVINAPNEDLKLKPGLTASVNIFTMECPDVDFVANKALRFTPSQEMLGEGESIADCDSPRKLWVKEGNVLKAYPVKTGVTNGSVTEVSGIAADKEVITDIMIGGMEEPEQGGNPFMPRPGGNRGGNRGGQGAQGGQAGHGAQGGPRR